MTDRFFDGVLSMEPGKVVLVPDFNMLEGARALEIGNPRLDTGLIKLSDEVLKFDSSKGQSLARVTALMDQVLVLCMTWMKGLSLLVTVLSCRYVLDLLSNYKEKKLVGHANFVNHRIHLEDYTVSEDVESQYVNVVLRAYILGIAKFIGFALRLGGEVLYEEEDMVTQTLGLDFMSQTSPQIVLAEIEAAEHWLSSSKDAKGDPKFILAMYYLRLAKQLVCFDDMMNLGINLFHPQKFSGLAFLKQAIIVVELLQKNEQNESVPFAFSTFAQLDQNNNNNPSKNVLMERSQAYKDMAQFLRTVDTIVKRLTQLESCTQLQQFLAYYVCHNLAANDCALARGIFQMFLIRDDKSIAGLNEDVMSIGFKSMEYFSLCGNSLIDSSQWNLIKAGDTAATREECSNRLMDLFNDIETATYHELSLYGNNRCRQRQLRNRSIVTLDTLQHKAETLEVELFHYGIGDGIFLDSTEQPALGISSFLYYKKLETMIDVALSGFELDVYQTSEASMMFWFVSELAAYANIHLSTRIVEINKSKILAISSLELQISKPKTINKSKAMREKHHNLKIFCLPILKSNLNYILKFAVLEKSALQDICAGIAMVIMLNTVQNTTSKRTEHLLVDQKQLYDLRMKPWTSVGSPPIPDYDQYCQRHGFLETATGDKFRANCNQAHLLLQNGILSLQELLNNLEADTDLRARLVNGNNREIEDWYQKLKETAKAYDCQIDHLSEKPEARLERTELFLPFFPMFSKKDPRPGSVEP